MAEATYTVRVAWEPVPSNAFTLDGSYLDGTDQLTNQYSDSLDVIQFGLSTFGGTDTFGGSFDGLYADVSSRVQSIQIRRGRSGNLDQFTAGEATIQLKDLNGDYSPLNTSSPLYPNVVPGRPISIVATFGTVEYGQFRGFVRSIEHDPAPDVLRTTINAQDLFLFLSRAKPTITNTGTITTGAAIGTVLTAIDWTDTRYRELGTGDTINVGFSNRGTADSGDGSTALQLIEGFLETERGEFFHARGGTVVYRDRYARYKRTSAGTITNAAAGATAATDLTNVRNRARVVKTGSGTATWVDYNSATNYGYSDFPSIDSAYINTAAQGTALAQWLVSQAKDPTPPVRALRFTANRSDSLMVQALQRDLGDRITVVDTAIQGTADFYIEGIDHAVRSGGKVHEVSYTLSKAPANPPIIFGTSTAYPGSRFDSADVFAF